MPPVDHGHSQLAMRIEEQGIPGNPAGDEIPVYAVHGIANAVLHGRHLLLPPQVGQEVAVKREGDDDHQSADDGSHHKLQQCHAPAPLTHTAPLHPASLSNPEVGDFWSRIYPFCAMLEPNSAGAAPDGLSADYRGCPTVSSIKDLSNPENAQRRGVWRREWIRSRFFN